jgi:hypothetical protein
MIKFSLYMTEIYQLFGRHKEAAETLERIATVLNDKAHCKPLFFEQAAYCYLHLGQYRKFSFYTKTAANFYKTSELLDYEQNSLGILHPFYQSHTGWN